MPAAFPEVPHKTAPDSKQCRLASLQARTSPNRGNQETPAQAFVRKMPKEGETVIDGQTGEEYDVK